MQPFMIIPMIGAAGGDPDVAAYLAAMTVQPDESRKSLIRDLISGLKIDGVWDSLDVLYLLAAHDRQAALLNVKSRAYDLTDGGSINFTTDRGTNASGTTSNANTFNTGLELGSSGRAANCHFGFVTPSASLLNSDAIGAASGLTYYSYIRPRNTSGSGSFKVNVSSTGTSASISAMAGHWIANRTASNASALYQSGTSRMTLSTSSSTHNNPLRIHGAGNGTGVDAFSARITAAHAGASLDSTQRTALQSRLNTYLSAIGAT